MLHPFEINSRRVSSHFFSAVLQLFPMTTTSDEKLKSVSFGITLLGTGSAWPDPDRSSPAFLISCEGAHYLIDCGGGTCHQLMRVGVPPPELTTVFLTHIHIDHCVEFPSLVFGAYLTGKSGAFELIGPKGVKAFSDSLFDVTYKFSRPMMRGLRNKEIEINVREVSDGCVFEKNGLSVSSLPVEHGFPTLGYRFEHNGKVIVLSGDTEPCENIITLSKNADILVIDCSFPEEFGHKKGHCIPSEVGKIASQAGVKLVCLVHLFPKCKGKEQEMIDEIAKFYSGPVLVGADLDTLTP